eukprot:6567852-Pyramimonas_sp.AAC.1
MLARFTFSQAFVILVYALPRDKNDVKNSLRPPWEQICRATVGYVNKSYRRIATLAHTRTNIDKSTPMRTDVKL